MDQTTQAPHWADRPNTPDQVDEPTVPTPGHRTSGWGRLRARWDQYARRQISDRDEIGNILEGADPHALATDAASFAPLLTDVTPAGLQRAIEVGKESNVYYAAALALTSESATEPPPRLPVTLSPDEASALVSEREHLFAQGRMFRVILTVSLCGFLQGFVQSSINGASLYADQLDYMPRRDTDPSRRDWYLGAMNASPFLSAAVLGCPASLVINYLMGRRGAIMVSALLIVASSLAAAWCTSWVQLTGVRIVAGVAMGVKAVSGPVLASETAIGYWRGSTLLSWQLWVANGIMLGFATNLALAQVKAGEGTDRLILQLILGAPAVPALALLASVAYCYESPRFYMRRGTPNYDPDKAWQILLHVRNTRLQALRDLFLIRWSNRAADEADEAEAAAARENEKPGLTYASQLGLAMKFSVKQYCTLLGNKRLQNAAWSACTVALAQQCCGVNVFAFYSGTLFAVSLGSGNDSAMWYSFGFGAVNFVFGLLAVRSIDTAGRRRWLLVTLPLMSLFLVAGAIAVLPSFSGNLNGLRAFVVFIYLFAAAYSPGLGPIPFTLASESFPLSHREAGTSTAIFINLLFAGFLTIVYPAMDSACSTSGALGIFAALNIVVFVLVYFTVEETRRLSLEELDEIYKQPKMTHVRYQAKRLAGFLRWKGREMLPGYDEYITERRSRRGSEDGRGGWEMEGVQQN